MRLLGDYVGKFKNHRPGDSKTRLDTLDMFKLYTKLDKEKTELPLFVAIMLAKVSGDTSAKCAVSVFAANLTDLKSNITKIQRAVTTLSGNIFSAGSNKGVSFSSAAKSYTELNGQRMIVDLGPKSFYCNEGDAEVDSSYKNGIFAGLSFAPGIIRSGIMWVKLLQRRLHQFMEIRIFLI